MQSHQKVAPRSADDVYLVLDDFGALGRCYRETDEKDADRETIIRHLIEGQFNAPVRVIAFNTAQGTVQDVSADIAYEVDSRAYWNWLKLTPNVARFVERQSELARPRKIQSSSQPRVGVSSVAVLALCDQNCANHASELDGARLRG